MEHKKKYLHLLHTGDGKGKTSAAMNMVYRHLSHGKKVAVVQFVKNTGEFPDGDRKMILALQKQGYPVNIHTMGTGFSWNSTDTSDDISAANEAFEQALEYMNDDVTRFVLLDEVHVAIHLGWLDESRVIEGIQGRQTRTHIVTTGRYAREAMIECADMVTEMTLVKHHFDQKIKAQPGIEF